MKKMTESKMMQANGGLASAKCPYCGKKFTGLFIAYARYAHHLETCTKRNRRWYGL